MTTFRLITADTADTLSLLVSAALSEGYTLHGNTIIVADRSRRYYQAVVRSE